MTALYRSAAWRGRIVEVDEHGARQSLGIEPLTHVLRKRSEWRPESAPAGRTHGFKGSTQARERATSETLHALLTAERGEGFLPFRKNVFRLEAPLRKHRAILLRLFGSVAPARLDSLGLFEFNEGEGSLAPS